MELLLHFTTSASVEVEVGKRCGGLTVRFIVKSKMMCLMFHFYNQALIQHLSSFLSLHTVRTHWPKLSVNSHISMSRVFLKKPKNIQFMLRKCRGV